jgi:hypothetical protein
MDRDMGSDRPGNTCGGNKLEDADTGENWEDTDGGDNKVLGVLGVLGALGAAL